MSERELQIQRLVDGQLDRQQIQQLLGRANQDASLWQDIAAAFVEEQVWQSEIPSSLFREPTETVEEPLSRTTVKPPDASSPNLKFWISLVAALVVGLFVGNLWELEKADSALTPTDVVTMGGANDTPLAADTGEQLVENKSPQTFLKPTHHLSMGDAVQIPLYTLDEARRLGLKFREPAIPQETIDQYRKQGYELEQNTQYVRGRTPDGRGIVVPIRSVRLNPGN